MNIAFRQSTVANIAGNLPPQKAFSPADTAPHFAEQTETAKKTTSKLNKHEALYRMMLLAMGLGGLFQSSRMAKSPELKAAAAISERMDAVDA